MRHFLKLQLVVIALFIGITACNPDNTKTEVSTSISAKSTLEKHIVQSNGHPMAVWEKRAKNSKGVILFVHGRTWSSVPDFDLQVEGEDLSLMDGLVEKGYTTYAVDLRGYGDTPRDDSDWQTPNKGAKDVRNILQWISEQNKDAKIHLFGWSMGSTVSLLATQQESTNIASLTLFGFWMDIDVTIPESSKDITPAKRPTTAKAAASDFITPGSISQKAIDTYVKMALKADPIRVDWKDMNQFNAIDPSKIETPVLILQGELDPIAPTDRQAKLFTRLKTADKSWVVISGGDHAAFMETPRKHFIHSFTEFINRFNE